MSGPQMGLSRVTEEIIGQTSDINGFVERMRTANRRLTGSTGQAPTPLKPPETGYAEKQTTIEEPPLMVRLTNAVELLNAARSDLAAEISYFESLAETAGPMVDAKPASAGRA